jgi:hypothetical protein
MRKIELFFARDTMATLYKVKRTTATPEIADRPQPLLSGARRSKGRLWRSPTLFTL